MVTHKHTLIITTVAQLIHDVPDEGKEVTREKEKLDKLNYIYVSAAQLSEECCLANAAVHFLATESAGMDTAHGWTGSQKSQHQNHINDQNHLTA